MGIRYAGKGRYIRIYCKGLGRFAYLVLKEHEAAQWLTKVRIVTGQWA